MGARCLWAFSGLLALVEGAFLKLEPLSLPLASEKKEKEVKEPVDTDYHIDLPDHSFVDVDIEKHLNPYVDKRYDANVAQLRKATATTDAKAKAAAAEAKQASKRVQELLKQNEDLLAKASDFSKEAELSVKDAEASDKKMEDELAKAKEYAKVAELGAKELAKKAVDDLFMGKYRELDSWRKEVLTDHWAEGRRAALQAAEPFEQAMGHAMEQANKYTMASSVLTSVSKGLKEQALKATLAASEKRIAGDFKGAARLDAAAKAMRSHGQDLTSYAKDLKTESEHLSQEAPTYLEGGLRAGRSAEYNANPQALPPLNADPALAYLPTA
mmetsp:Transcript_30972/g.72668  ORF Transcript_30972/g.72668 Transcript_30972/m.72668 type:complete len:328 (+) Transcript_30972:95-1078(+)